MCNLKKEELSAIIFQLLSVFITHSAWHDKAIFARGHVYATEGYCANPILECILNPVFSGFSDKVYVYRGKNPYGKRQILSINLGSGDYLTAYSYSPYRDVLEALQTVVAPYGLFFDFADPWILNLYEK